MAVRIYGHAHYPDGKGILRCVNAASEHCYYAENGSKAPNMRRLTTREGINAISAQCLGNAAAGLQTGLLQCSGGAPGVKCIIRLFPAWHMKHNTEFELFARDGFRVRAAVEDQVIASVVITSTFGGESLFANPWGGAARVSSVDGEELLEGELLRLDTRSGLDYTIAEAIG